VQGFIAVGGTRANGQGVVKILAISHANDQDLSVTLLHLPTGTPVPLFHERNTDDGSSSGSSTLPQPTWG
jgi:hypothetical protein